MDLGFIRNEISRMRTQVARQRREILLLQRAGIPTTPAEALLERMLHKIDQLCMERERAKAELLPSSSCQRVLGRRRW